MGEVATPRMAPDWESFTLQMPTEDELNQSARDRYSATGPFDIDRWPESVRQLSIPTTMVHVENRDKWVQMWDERDGKAVANFAELLDKELDWRMQFIRLNSRSPKDSAYPNLPITCAGKQAMWWISGSERCLDDSVTRWRAGAPIIVCLRQWIPIEPKMEFRCFAKDGKMIAVTRYEYNSANDIQPEYAATIMAAAQRFYEKNLSSHYGDVVFDLHAPGASREILIELNPYGLSDPCCFGTYEAVERGGLALDRLSPEPEG